MDLKDKVINNRYFLKYPALKQFTKFCLVGFFNTAIDFLVYLFLTRLFIIYFVLANACSFLVAVTWSFIFNKYWTFRNGEKKIKKQYLQFLFINVIGLILNTLILYTFVTYFNLYDLLAKALAIVIVLFWNFGMNRYWTFGEKKCIIKDNNLA
jgi:dolichol-phosphate mannosyltransferase